MRRLDARDSTNVLELRGEPGNGRGGNTGYMSPNKPWAERPTNGPTFFLLDCYGLSADERRGPGNPSVLCLATASSHLREGHGSPSRSRYQSVDELVSDISRYLEQTPVGAYRESFLDRADRLINRHKLPSC